ncbi:MAG: hypothetical protein JW825_00840 [Candidatus Methanofastidiosa archaeon]|nr:hypothetical protein [Candidatus Methanofastidiosa archaeon]
MAICPYCKGEISFEEVERDTKGKGFFKQEIMYSCPHCKCVLGFSRGNYG